MPECEEVAFFGRLSAVVPEFGDLYTQHVAEYGELLGHVLIADLMRWCCDALSTRPQEVDAVLRELSESLRSGDDPVSNMIAVSFLEGLGQVGGPPAEVALRERLPPNLLRQLRRFEGA